MGRSPTLQSRTLVESVSGATSKCGSLYRTYSGELEKLRCKGIRVGNRDDKPRLGGLEILKIGNESSELQ